MCSGDFLSQFTTSLLWLSLKPKIYCGIKNFQVKNLSFRIYVWKRFYCSSSQLVACSPFFKHQINKKKWLCVLIKQFCHSVICLDRIVRIGIFLTSNDTSNNEDDWQHNEHDSWDEQSFIFWSRYFHLMFICVLFISVSNSQTPVRTFTVNLKYYWINKFLIMIFIMVITITC